MTKQSGWQRIGAAFRQAAAEGRCALMPYMTMGYPRPAMTMELIAAVAAGADILELGIPFSDPIADGATIQQAAHIALQQGMTPALCLEMVAGLRAKGVHAPFLFMSYYNPIFVWGTQAFAEECRAAGVDGLIVPDLPVEEAGDLLAACHSQGLALIFLVAPNTSEQRLEMITARAEGFLYLVSRPGITGARDRLPDGLGDYVSRVRRHTHLPLALGFGISTPAQVHQVAALVDGAIVGSAVVEKAAQGAEAVAAFIDGLCKACRREHSPSLPRS